MKKLPKKQIKEIEKLLKEGKPLPEDYKYILFPSSKKEYELVYSEKEREEDILAETMRVPLQPVKTFFNDKKIKNGWTNKLIFGDNLQVLKELIYNPEIKGRVRLIYIDPPFATRQEFRGSQDQKAYQDKIIGAQFLEFLRKRLVFLRELLADDGSIYVHLDQRKGHYIKTLMDEIFGENNFRNQIIWRKTNSPKSQSVEFGNQHDIIFLYSKTQNLFYMKQIFSKVDKSYKNSFTHDDNDGRGPYQTVALIAGSSQRTPGRKVFEFHGIVAPWLYSRKNLDKFWNEGRIYKTKSGFRLKKYLSETKGRLVSDLWVDKDVSPLQGRSPENMGFPTQKPESVLHRIIEATSNPNDIVLDAFAGSGTTGAVAEKLGRRWIMIDCSKLAIYTMQKRLLNLREEIGNRGKLLKPKSFTLYNAGLYDYKMIKDLPWHKYREFVLKLFQCRDEKHTILGIDLDGYLGPYDVLVFNYQKYKDITLDYGFIDDLHAALGDKISKRFFIITPAANVQFLEDYVEKDGIKYFILRIPYSIISEIHERGFTSIKQPADERDVNDIMEAVGFDFIQMPKVRCRYYLAKPRKGTQLKIGASKEEAVINIEIFESNTLSRHPQEFKNLETLSMVMIDYDYNGEIFDLDDVFYAEDLKKRDYEIRFNPVKIGKQMMVIYMDIFGNEKKEIKTLKDFKK